MTIAPLDVSNEISQEDKDAIWDIQNESFGAYELPPRKDFETWYQQDSQTLLVARDKRTGSIIGFLLFNGNESQLDLNILARKANAAKRSIGTLLLDKFITDYCQSGVKASLCVRESHSGAQTLYRKFGFKDAGYTTPQRACPMERDLIMIRTGQ